MSKTLAETVLETYWDGRRAYRIAKAKAGFLMTRLNIDEEEANNILIALMESEREEMRKFNEEDNAKLVGEKRSVGSLNQASYL